MATRAMSGRSHLSIGDVLSLLREEFPDVTISKIRFLESQGLVNPERSPSGYRKFYDDDVARLRWVLRKQRDQFLPLKVIRDRLAAAGNGVPPDDDPVADWEPDAETSPTTSSRRGGAHAVVGAGGRDRNGPGGEGTRPRAEAEVDEEAEDEAVEPRPATAVTPAPDARTPRATGAGERPPAGGAATAGHAGEEPAVPVAAAPIPSQAEEGGRPGARPTGAAASVPSGAAASVPSGATGVPAPSGAGAAGMLSASVSSVSLTLGELCAATGLTPDVVASLEGLGLVSAMSIAGGMFYDEEALTVGKLVVEFARYGIEPRHLRMYRNAADREVGLVEQVIAPLLRQRNPEARQRAVEAAADLARLGQSVRASLVRSELRRQLGG